MGKVKFFFRLIGFAGRFYERWVSTSSYIVILPSSSDLQTWLSSGLEDNHFCLRIHNPSKISWWSVHLNHRITCSYKAMRLKKNEIRNQTERISYTVLNLRLLSKELGARNSPSCLVLINKTADARRVGVFSSVI